MQGKALLAIVVAALCFITSAASPSCLDQAGNPVDWFFMYKMGSVVGDYKGYEYAYFDANSHGKYVDGDLNQTNAIVHTINQMFNDNDGFGWLMYNDQTYDTKEDRDRERTVNHEDDGNGHIYAHMKGDLVFDGQQGFWLAHSVPGFPLDHTVRYAGYPVPNWVYLRAQSKYGQTFYCVSVTTDTINKIAGLLLYDYPHVYDYNIPKNIASQVSNVQKLASGNLIKGASNITFSSLGGKKYVAFGKTYSTESDLYEDYVAPGLNTGLKTETWCGGTFGFECMASYCAGNPIQNPSNPQRGQSTYAYDSVNILKLSFGENLWFTNEYDHAKWALAYNGGQTPPAKWFCAADMNRMSSQRKRGGGALCTIDDEMWDAMERIITKYDTACEN